MASGTKWTLGDKNQIEVGSPELVGCAQCR